MAMMPLEVHAGCWVWRSTTRQYDTCFLTVLVSISLCDRAMNSPVQGSHACEWLVMHRGAHAHEAGMG